MMPAHAREGVGVKLVTLALGNADRGLPLIHGAYVLFSRETLEPVAIVDGTALTALRTAAVSALATRRLARPDASRLVVFGAGVQATAHVEAMMVVRDIDHASSRPDATHAAAGHGRPTGGAFAHPKHGNKERTDVSRQGMVGYWPIPLPGSSMPVSDDRW